MNAGVSWGGPVVLNPLCNHLKTLKVWWCLVLSAFAVKLSWFKKFPVFTNMGEKRKSWCKMLFLSGSSVLSVLWLPGSARSGGSEWRAPMGFTGGHKALPGIRCRQGRCTKEVKQTKPQTNCSLLSPFFFLLLLACTSVAKSEKWQEQKIKC